MIEFGKTLRNAREAKGYTVSQIADMTHLKSQVVEGLENEDFSMIAAPIYGRGFVKLYCEAVGLEAKPMVDEFMAIVNGDRETAIKERPVAPPPAEEPQPPPPVPPAPAAVEPDLFRQDPLPPPEPVAPEPIAPEPTLSRYASPVDERPLTAGVPALNPRIIALVGLLAALLIAALFGIRALYRATRPDAPAASAAAEAAPKTVAKAAPRTPQNIPSLYID